MIKRGISKLKNKNSIIYLVVTLCISLAIGVTMFWTATPVAHYEPNKDDLIESLHVDSNTKTNHITIDNSGMMNFEQGEDCYFQIDDIEKGGKTLAIKFDRPFEYDQMIAYVSLDYGDGYKDDEIDLLQEKLSDLEHAAASDEAIEAAKTELDKYSEYKIKATCLKNAKYICVQLPREDYVGIRVRTTSAFGIEAVEIHESGVVGVESTYPKTPFRIAVGIIAGILLWLVLIVLEVIFDISKCVEGWCKANKNYLIQDVAALVVSILLALTLNLIRGEEEYSAAYNVFWATAFLCVFVLIRNGILAELPVERTFFAIVMICGIAMIFISPVGLWSWDEQTHFYWAIQSSGVRGTIGITDADLVMTNLLSLQGDGYSETINNLNSIGQYVSGTVLADMKIYTLPGGIGYGLARLFNFAYIWRFNAGTIGQLFVYALCGYFGIKRLHSGKMIFATVMMIPTALFLATNYSYDYWVICFTMLGMAYFVGMCQEKDSEVKYKDIIIMCVAMAFGCIPKQIYVPIIIFPLLIMARKIKDKKWIYYGIVIATFVLVFASFFMRSSTEIASTGDARGGDVGPSDQLANIMSNPVWYAGVLIRFMLNYINPMITHTGTDLAYFNAAPGYMIIVVTLAFVTLTDKNEYDVKAYSTLSRLYTVPFFLGEIALMASALYLTFSPVGSEYMAGCQPRYMLPLIYPLCAIITGRGINLRFIKKKYYNVAILGILVFMIYYDMFHNILWKSIY